VWKDYLNWLFCNPLQKLQTSPKGIPTDDIFNKMPEESPNIKDFGGLGEYYRICTERAYAPTVANTRPLCASSHSSHPNSALPLHPPQGANNHNEHDRDRPVEGTFEKRGEVTPVLGKVEEATEQFENPIHGEKSGARIEGGAKTKVRTSVNENADGMSGSTAKDEGDSKASKASQKNK